jgi:Fe-S cluster biosynthesis and repair protein YggX
VYANGKKLNLSDEQVQQVRDSRTNDLPRILLHLILRTAFVQSDPEPESGATVTRNVTRIQRQTNRNFNINGRQYQLTIDEAQSIFGAGLPAPEQRSVQFRFMTSSEKTDTGEYRTKTFVYVNGKKLNLSDKQVQQVRDSRTNDLPRTLLHLILRTAFVQSDPEPESGATVTRNVTRMQGQSNRNFNINGRQYQLTIDEIQSIFGAAGLPAPEQRSVQLRFMTSSEKTDTGVYRTKTFVYANGKKLNLSDEQVQKVRDSRTNDLSRMLLHLILRTAFVQSDTESGATGDPSTQPPLESEGVMVDSSRTRGDNFNINGRQYQLTTAEVQSIFGATELPAPKQRTVAFRFRTSSVQTNTGSYTTKESIYVNGKKLNANDAQIQQIRDSRYRDLPRTLLHLILRTAFVQSEPEFEPEPQPEYTARFYIFGRPYDLTPQEIKSVFHDSPLPAVEDRSLIISFRRSPSPVNGLHSTAVYVNGQKAPLNGNQMSEMRAAGSHNISRSLLQIILRTAYNGMGESHAEVPKVSTTVSTTLTKPTETTRFYIGGRSYDLTPQEVISIFGDYVVPPVSERSIRVSFRTSTSRVDDGYITTTSVYANRKKATLTDQEVKQMRRAESQDISARLLRIIIRTAFDLHVTGTEVLPTVATTESSVGDAAAEATRFYIGGRGYDLSAQEVTSIFGTSDTPPKRDRAIALSYRMSSTKTDEGTRLKTSVFLNGKAVDLTDDEVQLMRDARRKDISRNLLMKILRIAYVMAPKIAPTVQATGAKTFYINNRPYDLTDNELQMLFGDGEIPQFEQQQVAITFRSKSKLTWTGWKTTTTVYVNGKVIELTDDQVTVMKGSAVTDISRDLLMKILRAAYVTETSGFERLTSPPIIYNINGRDVLVSLADFRGILGASRSRPEGIQNILMTFRSEVQILGDGWGVVNNVYLNDKKGDFTDQQVQQLKESTNNKKPIAHDFVLMIIKAAFGKVRVGQRKSGSQVMQGQTYFNINGKQVGFSAEEMQTVFGANGPPPVGQRAIQMSFQSRAVQSGREWKTETTVVVNGKQANLMPNEKNILRTANTRGSYDTIPRDVLQMILKLAFNDSAMAKQTTPSMVQLGKTKGTEAAVQIESKEISVSHDELSKVLGAAYSPASRGSMEIKFGDMTESGEGEVPDVTVFVNGQKIYLTPEETREIADYYAHKITREEDKRYNERLPDAKPTSGQTLSPQLIQKIIDATSGGRSAENGGRDESLEEGINYNSAEAVQKKPISLLEHIRSGDAENGQNMKSTTKKPKNAQLPHHDWYAESDYPEDEPRKADGTKKHSLEDQLRKDEEIWKMMSRMFRF